MKKQLKVLSLKEYKALQIRFGEAVMYADVHLLASKKKIEAIYRKTSKTETVWVKKPDLEKYLSR